MDRSRSKRYYYDHQDYDPIDTIRTTKPRYTTTTNHHYHRRNTFSNAAGPRKVQDPSSLMVTTSYRILCPDAKAGGVIGKSGSIIKAIRQHTGAWINVHELVPGDEERIIEVSDTRRRDPDGRMPNFSPAQEALLLIHERILKSEGGGYNLGYGGDDDDVYGGRGGVGVGGGGGGSNRLVSRLVVSRLHVGSLLGKGGKIIEQMRMETKTHIRILPRDHTIPRCVDMSEEIVQVVGDINSVKNAMDIISSRLRESQHRDRSHLFNKLQSSDKFFPPEDDFMYHQNNIIHRPSMDGPNYRSRLPDGLNNSRSFNHGSRPSSYDDIVASPLPDNAQSLYAEDLVFRILCPSNKVDSVIGQSDGFMELLQNEIGVDVRVADRVAGSDEQVITVFSDEGADDDLFPAQEALLHIQTRILDLVPNKENIVTTRLLLSGGEAACLDDRDGFLADTKKMTGADIQILPRENLPRFVSVNDELVQIVGEIKAAREALVEVTLRLRNYLYQGFSQKDGQPSPFLAPSPVGSASNMEAASSNITTSRETYTGNDKPSASNDTTAAPAPAKNNAGSNGEPVNLTESGTREDAPSSMNRIVMPMVTRSTLEVVIPEYAVPKLITKSRNKLAQISELSGANVQLVDTSPEATEHVIKISGTREQAERAQSLLQGFILSIQDDGP
ncbi:putative K domain-containing protein [Helianthus debilis subsp. tardiflorus]